MHQQIYINKKNLRKYMINSRIKTDNELLQKIASLINEPEPLKYADKERGNFSNMINGKRTLKVEYIIPLEKIFGVTLAQLINEEDYAEPDKKDFPYIKGINYYAHKDDMKLYETEFLSLIREHGKCALLFNIDEFENTFLDYVVKYNSINAIKFLAKNFHFRAHPYNSSFFIIEDQGVSTILVYPQERIAELLLKNNLYALFYRVFYIEEYFLETTQSLEELVKKPHILELFLKKEQFYKSIFDITPIKFDKLNRQSNYMNINYDVVDCINPIINYCLNYALGYVSEYEPQIKEMLNFGINYNEQKIKEISEKFGNYHVDSNGEILNRANYRLGSIVHLIRKDIKTTNIEINSLLERLLKII